MKLARQNRDYCSEVSCRRGIMIPAPKKERKHLKKKINQRLASAVTAAASTAAAAATPAVSTSVRRPHRRLGPLGDGLLAGRSIHTRTRST